MTEEGICTVTGIFNDSNGKPLEEVEIEFFGPSKAKIPNPKTNKEGTFDIELEEGSYDWIAFKEGYVQEKGNIKVKKGGDNSIGIVSLKQQTDAFENLTSLISRPRFALIPPVNIEEARQFMRLYRVGNYILADVTGSIAKLNQDLTSGVDRIGLKDKDPLMKKYGATIDAILNQRSENSKTEDDILKAIRQQFDAGTASASNVNTEFKMIFKRFVSLCNDELLAVDPDEVNGKVSWDAKKQEELRKFLKNVKKELINLVQNMSMAGTKGTEALVQKWSGILNDSLFVLDRIGEEYISSDDQDAKYFKSVLVNLNSAQMSTIEPYLVHAKEGSTFLDNVIKIYAFIQNDGKLEDETDDYMRDLFHDGNKIPSLGGKEASNVLRENASMILQYWPKNWG